MGDVTRILSAIEDGDPHASEQLLPLVYDELRRLATHKMAQEAPEMTLQATALVHEAYIRLVGANGSNAWNGRGHFFSSAAEAMRRILVEDARRKTRKVHGGELHRLDILDVDTLCKMPPRDVLALDDALERLKQIDPVKAQLVHLRFFAGMNNEEVAQTLGLSSATVKRYWRFARAWLRAEMSSFEES